MSVNQTEGLKLAQRSVIKCLVGEKCKPCEIYRIMHDEEVCFSQKNVFKWVKHDFAMISLSQKKNSQRN